MIPIHLKVYQVAFQMTPHESEINVKWLSYEQSIDLLRPHAAISTNFYERGFYQKFKMVNKLRIKGKIYKEPLLT